jgi:ribose transport system ATP-binding protein
MPAHLELRGVSKRFGATVALADVSATFPSGSIHCVLGENGAGKSTLGRIIGGVSAKDGGTLLIDGREVDFSTVARARELGIAVAFQELSLAPDLSVRANLLLGSESGRHPFALLQREAEYARVMSVLERLDLRLDPETRVGALPIATQQLLEVAKALIRNPWLVVLDEPTAMLNETEKHTLYTALSLLRADGKALILITHHLEDVEAVADHVSVMRDGRLIDSFAVSRGQDFGPIAEKLGGGTRRQPKPEIGRAQETPPFLEISGLSDRAGRPAPLALRRGEIVGLYGVVGCGAERISAALAGLRRAGQFELQIDGVRRTVRTPSHARTLGIAYLPAGRAGNGILPGRSIAENLNISLLGRHSRGGIISRKAEAAATRERLRASAVKYRDAADDILQLSGGNQQKILIARVLSAATRVAVLEEPTAGVDIGAKKQILNAIRARCAEGLAVILVSSDLEATIDLVDTLYTLYSGTVMARYSSPQLEDRPAIVADIIGHQLGDEMRSGRPKDNESLFEAGSRTG